MEHLHNWMVNIYSSRLFHMAPSCFAFKTCNGHTIRFHQYLYTCQSFIQICVFHTQVFFITIWAFFHYQFHQTGSLHILYTMYMYEWKTTSIPFCTFKINGFAYVWSQSYPGLMYTSSVLGDFQLAFTAGGGAGNKDVKKVNTNVPATCKTPGPLGSSTGGAVSVVDCSRSPFSFCKHKIEHV